MIQENKIIPIIKIDELKNRDKVQFNNCIIDTLDLIGEELHVHLIIENCIINNLYIHACCFANGFTLKRSIINSYIDYHMGGHNEAPIIIQGNVFKEFFNFFDCQFHNIIEFKYNILEKGTNLLGNIKPGI